MYYDDNRDVVVRNWTTGTDASTCAWIIGDAANSPVLLQTNYLTRGALFAYNKSLGIYKCPADRSLITGSQFPRVRSYSISTGMNWVDQSDCSLADDFVPPGGKPRIYRFNQIVDPGPSRASVFLDEREDSIDNGACGIYPVSAGIGYWNVPGTRHSRGCNLTFADAHAEHWRWLDPWITTTPIGAVKFTLTSPNDRDAQRIQQTVPFDY